MARNIARWIESALRRFQVRQNAEMESFLAARSPQQLTCLRGFLGSGALAQRSVYLDVYLQGSKGRQQLQFTTLTACQHSPESSTPMQQKRLVTTSPRTDQLMPMYNSSIATGSPPQIVAKALDLLRSRDHLQQTGDTSAAHVELMRTLELAQEFYRHSRMTTAGAAIVGEQLQKPPDVHKHQQRGECLVGPAEYEGMTAQLPQEAMEAGVILGATTEERRQSLFDMALDSAVPVEADQRPDRWGPGEGTLHQGSHVTPHQLSEPALAALAALAPQDQDSHMSKSEQPSSMASAPLQSSAGQERADLTSSSGAQCRNIHSAPVPAQAPAVGDRLELECSSIAFGGQGVCKLPSGFTVFCERALPGERLTARVTAAKKSFATAHKVEVLRQHSDAVEAPCVHFQEGCGGCTMQNLAYASQLRAKEQQVVEALRRIGKLEGAESLVRPALPCEQPLHYRNKMSFSLTSPQSPGGLSTGYGFKKVWDASGTVHVSSCHLQDDTANQILRCLTTAAQRPSSTEGMPSLSIRGKDGVMGQPLVKRLTIRSGLHPDSGAPAHLAILHVSPSVPAPAKADEARSSAAGTDKAAMQATMQSVAQMLMREMPGLAGVVQHRELNTAGKRVNQVHTLVGTSKLQQQLCGLKLQLSPLAFFQTNTKQAEVMYSMVAEAAGLSQAGDQHLLDLYCGTGTIALSLAPQCASVTGVESVMSAVADAKVNARENNIKRARFLKRDLAKSGAFTQLDVQPDVIIADPPRAGLDGPVIEYLKSCSAKTVVYVSCDPVTQARDLQKLCDEKHNGPFELQYVQPVDMFPQTHHIETVALLRRR